MVVSVVAVVELESLSRKTHKGTVLYKMALNQHGVKYTLLGGWNN